MPRPVAYDRTLCFGFCLVSLVSQGACSDQPAVTPPRASAVKEAPLDLLLRGGKVYSLSWGEPDAEGRPAADAPYDDQGWHADAEAVGIIGDRIVFVGTAEAAATRVGDQTRILELGGATVVPGLVDSHMHVAEIGRTRSQLDLVGVKTPEEAVARVVAHAAKIPEGQWIVGNGWDEGPWADRWPTMELLSKKVPGHPVLLEGLHGFAVWGNRRAFEMAGISKETRDPSGGVIVRDKRGAPTGILLNRAVVLLREAVPAPSLEERKRRWLVGLEAMAESGFTEIHEAGVPTDSLEALQSLDAEGKLPIHVYAMLSARDAQLMQKWNAKGPWYGDHLTVRAVKAYYDASLGSRGARLLADYSDKPGHRGVAGAEYGFDKVLVATAMKKGFQVGVHAIGDAGNREVLDFFEGVIEEAPASRAGRHRIEHAQVISPEDMGRFARLGVIASMEPPHAMEDKDWAQERLGAERVKGAYAWRTLRRAGARLIFNSDLPGADFSIGYGLHSAITRQSKDGRPPGGSFPEQRMSPEEALRGYTTWAAYAAFREDDAGSIAVGKAADLTVLSVDPLLAGEASPRKILDTEIVFTIVDGAVVYQAGDN